MEILLILLIIFAIIMALFGDMELLKLLTIIALVTITIAGGMALFCVLLDGMFAVITALF